MKSGTAICVFAYKRPKHLRACLSALLRNREARDLDLRIYVDAPRHVSDLDAHKKVLSVCYQSWPFSSLRVIQRETNIGLYKSLTTGITETLCDYESVIVIEDDIEASPFLIQYLLDGIELYHSSKDVASIHGYTPPIKDRLPETFFLRGADCWGWATWRDRWKLFRSDAVAMAAEIRQKDLIHEFNLNGHYDYLAMLDRRAVGLNNSWAICWHASCFLADKLTLYPGESLVRNIGLDRSGEHCVPSKLLATDAAPTPIRVDKIPLEVNSDVYLSYCNHFSTDRPRAPTLKAIRAKVNNRIFELLSRKKPPGLNLTGPYDSYNDAASHSTGYNSQLILGKVYDATIDVLEGKSAYERDGTAFATRPPIDNLRRLLSTQLKENDVVVDFGGGLGGSYINNRDLFVASNRYTVVEQAIFAEAGRELSKYYDFKVEFIDDLTHLSARPDIVILSSVLQYIPNAEQVLLQVSQLMPNLIIIDRTALSPDYASQKWYIQQEPVYYQIPVSYPNRPLFPETIISIFGEYSVLEEWDSPFDPKLPPHRGFLLCRQS